MGTRSGLKAGFDVARVKELIRDIPDFPRPGVVYKDITPLLADARGLSSCVDALADRFDGVRIDKVVGIEARGFIIAAPVAYALGAGFVPLRKKGKLPYRVHSEAYDLEYGSDTIEVHTDALGPDDHALIVDDVLATGGTALATGHLLQKLGAQVVGMGCVIELMSLGGRKRLAGVRVEPLVAYE
jgi:adenine phosphoribosyltransferase